MKKLLGITLILAVLFSFAGCLGYDKEEIELMDKLSKIESFKSVSESKFDMSAQIPDEIKYSFAPISIDSYLRALSELEYISETEVAPEKIKSVFTVNTATGTDKFVYYKIIGENENNILLLPTPVKALLPEKYTQADYVSFNGDSLEKIITNLINDDTETDAEQTAETMKIMLETVGNAFTLYAMNVKLPENLVTKSGNTYTVSLDDTKLKSFAKSFVNTYFENEQARENLDTALNEIAALLGSEEDVFGFERPEEMIAVKAQVDAFFAILDNIKIVADDGINIVYTFDAAGNIVKAETDMNLVFDINLMNAVTTGTNLYEQPFVINLSYKNTTNYTDVNKLAADKIEIPEISPDKCVDIADWINEYINITAEKNKSYYPEYPEIPETDDTKSEIVLPAPDGSVTVMVYGSPIDFGDFKPVNVDGTLYVPYEFLEIYYDTCEISGKTLALNTDYDEYVFRVGSSEIDAKEYKMILSKPVLEINSHIYVPLRSTAKAIFGYDVKWDGQLNGAYLV